MTRPRGPFGFPRLILLYSFIGDTVLDPFLGSGRTAAVAVENGRNVVGYELREELAPEIQSRMPVRMEFDNDRV